MGYTVDPADLQALIDSLAAVDGLDQTWSDGDQDRPAQVVEIGQPLTTPGVVVQVLGYTFDALNSYAMRGRLLLVVSDQKSPEARTALADLLNLVSSVVPPKGEVTHEAVTLPDRPGSPLPALSVPFVVRCTPA